jgi:hypothetical protein
LADYVLERASKEPTWITEELLLAIRMRIRKGGEMTERKLLSDFIDRSANRRSFVKKLGIASAAVGAAAAIPRGFAQSTTLQDSDILNFALNLEYLEAEFYTVATTGQTLSQFGGITVTGSGSAGATTGGSQVAFGTSNTTVQSVALELAADERAHVTLLQTAIAGLGATAVAKPAINLNALGFGFGSINDFLKLARIFEDIGVTAYGGAAPLISSKTILGYAARILATEALHAGNIRLLVSQAGISTFPPLDGADHLPPPSGNEYFTTDSSAITEVRTPGQVLSLAYGANNVTSGGFFPNGVNGIVNASATAVATSDGATITASPNPIPVTSGDGTTTISWNVPFSTLVQIRINSPNGPLFAYSGSSGSMQTGPWVTDGMTFYLQTANAGDQAAGTTLATVVVHLVP